MPLAIEEENKIPPPKSPVVVKMNLWILGRVFDWFMRRYLPTFGFIITSEYRTQARNREVGGAANSAHVHGLARDVVLTRKSDGAQVLESQAEKVFKEFILPHWPGYALFEPAAGGEGYHIHLNLSRQIGIYAAAVAVAGAGYGLFKLLQNLTKGKANK